MAIDKKIEEILNEQINAEFWAAYLYLSMSAYFNNIGLPGFANWMKVQYHEENQHALRIFNYIHNRGGRVFLKPIKKVETIWDSVLHVYEVALDHEMKVTKMIDKCMSMAIEAKDHATASMLQWFVDEQVQEEAIASEIIDKLKLFDAKGPGLFYMDKEFATRRLNEDEE